MILSVSQYSESSDVFSLGLIFAEFYNLIPLFCGSSNINQLTKYINNLGTQDLIYWREGIEQINKINYKVPRNPTCNLKSLLPKASPIAID
jgi:serine/threonine protein kinase